MTSYQKLKEKYDILIDCVLTLQEILCLGDPTPEQITKAQSTINHSLAKWYRVDND